MIGVVQDRLRAGEWMPLCLSERRRHRKRISGVAAHGLFVATTIFIMPRKTSLESLAAFIREQDADTLAVVLLELAEDHAAVRDRLARLQLSNKPRALVAAFRKPLTAWRRSTKYLDYSQAPEFGRELEAWLGQIERELMPGDPPAALALAEAFIETDHVFFERADDSDGAIGDAIRAGCRLWLKAASRCESPATEWPSRISALVAADEYGAREELLRRAHLLLSEEALRAFVASYEAELDDAPAQAGRGKSAMDGNWKATAALSLLSEALRDPDVLARAMLKESPSLNPVQKEHLVRAYVEYDRPEGALPWLEGTWSHLESSRQRLNAQVLTRVGRTSEATAVRRQIFEETLAVSDLHAWLESLPPEEQGRAIEHARVLAGAHDDPVVVALLLLAVGDDAGAEAALLAAPHLIQGNDYGRLRPLAAELETQECWKGSTAVYRALLVSILERAYAPAYQYGARYWAKLQVLAHKNPELLPLEPAAAFEARIRVQHGRKSSFWAHVNRA